MVWSGFGSLLEGIKSLDNQPMSGDTLARPNSMKIRGGKLTLRFDDRQKPRLTNLEFWPAESDTATFTPRSAQMALAWQQAAMGFSLCLIAYKTWGLTKKRKSLSFSFPADKRAGASFADSLGNPTWIKNWLAHPKTKDTEHGKIFYGDNLGGRSKEKPRIIRIYQDYLPPANVRIEWQGRGTTTRKLTALAGAIDRQWHSHRKKPGSQTESLAPIPESRHTVSEVQMCHHRLTQHCSPPRQCRRSPFRPL
jgi:hypothetical protein